MSFRTRASSSFVTVSVLGVSAALDAQSDQTHRVGEAATVFREIRPAAAAVTRWIAARKAFVPHTTE